MGQVATCVGYFGVTLFLSVIAPCQTLAVSFRACLISRDASLVAAIFWSNFQCKQGYLSHLMIGTNHLDRWTYPPFTPDTLGSSPKEFVLRIFFGLHVQTGRRNMRRCYALESMLSTCRIILSLGVTAHIRLSERNTSNTLCGAVVLFLLVKSAVSHGQSSPLRVFTSRRRTNGIGLER